MTFAAGDLGGGVKAQGSGDAGLVGQAQAGQTSQGLFTPGREPNSRSGAVTAVTLAIQVAAQIGGSARGYQGHIASLTAGQTQSQSRRSDRQGRMFIHCRSYRERTHLPPTVATRGRTL
jgi:hypothetical protein